MADGGCRGLRWHEARAAGMRVVTTVAVAPMLVRTVLQVD
jgi:hypothetical protein